MKLGLWVACSAVAVFSAGVASAQQAPAARTTPVITVEGEASEAFLPDKAILSFGVVTEQPRAIDAASQNGKAVEAVIDAVKQEGIEARAIQSSSVSLEPIFKQGEGGDRKIVGFRASNQLEVEVAPPQRAGLLAGKLIDRGVNTIDGIRFTSDANADRADRLRGLAMRDARHKAESYVGALGLKLGRVIDITPAGMAPRLNPRMIAGTLKAAPVAVPVEPGQQTDAAAVSVTWEIAE